jgi:hypothetical protein
MRNLLNDKVCLIKPDGRRFENIEANVQPNMIFIDNAKLPIEEGDKITRKLPNNLIETYIVLDRGYYEGIHGIPSHYQIKVRKESAINSQKPSSIIYQIDAKDSKVNINSSDSSVNIVNITSMNMFSELKKTIETYITDSTIKTQLIDSVCNMEKNQGTNNFLKHYQEFISIAANHMTLLAPFLPALTQLLK